MKLERIIPGAVWLIALGCALSATTAERPTVSIPRATSGDTAIEPDWSQRLTVTVGPANADIVGTNERALQAAVDYVTRLGGGTVQILPGAYHLRNAVYLQSKLRFIGSGPQTVLTKAVSATAIGTIRRSPCWMQPVLRSETVFACAQRIPTQLPTL